MEDTKHYFQLKGKNAEKIVHGLAEKSFLTDWCYPNPTLQSGKELCDLLVVFDNVAIIWQIKDLRLDKNGKYKKAEVDKNLRQLSGAQRQLFELKSKIELSNARRGKEIFDPNSITEVYLISVLLGEGEDYYSALEEIKGHNVHVFTKEFTQIVLNELDTINDFCTYLRLKEKFFTEKPRSIIVSGGEQELLAAYLRGGRSFVDYEKADKIFLDGGIWDGLLKEPRFIKKKKLDKISYGWDSIINRAHTGSSKYEVVARELARPNRFERRYLSKVFMEAHVMAHEDKSGADLFRRIMPSEGVTYCFLFMDDFEEPRTKRQAMLASIGYFARGKFPQNKKVIGIATEKKLRPISSYDFVLVDIPIWNDEDQKKVEQLQKETGMFVNPIMGEAHEDEYPEN
jgi:hypothetical protein